MPRILIVDDDKRVVMGIARLLRLDGHVVREVIDSTTALEAVREFDPDVVICDWMMPDLDGEQVLRLVRDEYPHIGRILISASAVDRVDRRVYDVFLAKPWPEGALQAALVKVLYT